MFDFAQAKFLFIAHNIKLMRSFFQQQFDCCLICMLHFSSAAQGKEQRSGGTRQLACL